LVVDEKGLFREENFQQAIGSLSEDRNISDSNGKVRGGGGKGNGKKDRSTKGMLCVCVCMRSGFSCYQRSLTDECVSMMMMLLGPSDIFKIVKMIMIKNFHPVIVFCFSKRECEALALQMTKLDLNDRMYKNYLFLMLHLVS